MAVVTVQTLSQQLGKAVLTEVKLLLSGLDFLMDGWLQVPVMLRCREEEEKRTDSCLD